MAKRLAIPALFLSVILVASAYASAFLPGGAPAWAAAVMAIGIAGTMVSLMSLGAARGGRIGVLALPFAFTFMVVAGGFLLVLALPPADPDDLRLWLGLPRRTAVVLYGIGLLPLLVMPLAYALTFDRMTLSEADLETIRRKAAALRGADVPDSGVAAHNAAGSAVRLEPRGKAATER